MGLFDNVDKGTVAGAAGLGILGKLIQSTMKANAVNKYAKRAGVNYDVGNFYAADPSMAYEQIQAMQNAAYQQRIADYLSQQGGLPSGPLEGVKQAYSTVAGPMELQRQKDAQAMNQGRLEASSLPAIQAYLDPMFAMPSQQASQQGGLPQVQDNRGMPTAGPGESVFDPTPIGPQALQAGVSDYNVPELPPDIAVTPETLRSMMSMMGTQRGQDITARGQDISSETQRRGQDLTRLTAQDRIAETRRMNDARMRYMEQQIGISRQRVAIYAKSIQQRQGRAPTKVEIAQAMLRNREITPQQFRDFIIKGPEIDVMGALLGGASTPSGGGIPSISEWDPGGE